MKSTPQTIQIFLPGGDPRGIRIAEITTRIMQVIEVPRSLLSDFQKMPESNQVALYFLVGESDDGDEPQVYVGQTGDLRARLAKHNKDKDFWERALVVISRTNSLTQTHCLFLEWHSLQTVRDVARYSDQNGNSGTRPHTPAPLEADCLEIFETASTLIATLGHPLFTKLAASKGPSEEQEIFYCKGSEANGRGLYTQEGFVVLKDSSGRIENVPSIGSLEAFRSQLLNSDIVQKKGDRFRFSQDHLFNSPSRAAVALMGRRANGWLEWKDEAGRTLDELKRQSDDS